MKENTITSIKNDHVDISKLNVDIINVVKNNHGVKIQWGETALAYDCAAILRETLKSKEDNAADVCVASMAWHLFCHCIPYEKFDKMSQKELIAKFKAECKKYYDAVDDFLLEVMRMTGNLDDDHILDTEKSDDSVENYTDDSDIYRPE